MVRSQEEKDVREKIADLQKLKKTLKAIASQCKGRKARKCLRYPGCNPGFYVSVEQHPSWLNTPS